MFSPEQGKPPGGEFQRQMILHPRLGDTEAEYGDIQKWRLRKYNTQSAEMVADVKNRFVASYTGASRLKRTVQRQRSGGDLHTLRRHAPDLHPHTARRPSGSHVNRVQRDFPGIILHTYPLLIKFARRSDHGLANPGPARPTEHRRKANRYV